MLLYAQSIRTRIATIASNIVATEGKSELLALWTLRALGTVGMGALGWWISLSAELSSPGSEFLPWGLVFTGAGLLLGAAVIHGCIALGRRASQAPGTTLVSAALGLLVGLAVAALVSIPFYALDGIMDWVIPVVISLSLGAGGLWLGAQRAGDVRAILPALDRAPAVPETVFADDSVLPAIPDAGNHSESRNGSILVDTSAIIDGRIADLTLTGFIDRSLLVPRFVLDELRHIADSSDSMRRNRGRRGLEVLGRLRKDTTVPMRVLDVGLESGEEVDARLVELARGTKSSILTTDYNLNRVAEIQGVQVLNVNELANAVKSIVLPGENLRVDIMQEGKEAGQGVAYLDDGTMVVVEGGRRFINSARDVQVTRVLQTNAGRIVFAQPR